MVPIFKKRDQRRCSNYRGTTLLSLADLCQGIKEESLSTLGCRKNNAGHEKLEPHLRNWAYMQQK